MNKQRDSKGAVAKGMGWVSKALLITFTSFVIANVALLALLRSIAAPERIGDGYFMSTLVFVMAVLTLNFMIITIFISVYYHIKADERAKEIRMQAEVTEKAVQQRHEEMLAEMRQGRKELRHFFMLTHQSQKRIAKPCKHRTIK